MQHNTTPAYANINQVAAHFAVTKRTIFNWVSAGILPAPVKFGRTNRWLWSDLQKIAGGRHD